MARILKESGRAVCLIKPQFEAGREEVTAGKGIIRDASIHEKVIEKVIESARENGLFISGLSYSPVKGAKGNIEYLLALSKSQDMCYDVSCIQEVVENSHAELE
jgi:23S rRNA (cytidine1920-2'-O)/16S rRNA (cytidine1409-2'-O)-methyltransferase